MTLSQIKYTRIALDPFIYGEPESLRTFTAGLGCSDALPITPGGLRV